MMVKVRSLKTHSIIFSEEINSTEELWDLLEIDSDKYTMDIEFLNGKDGDFIGITLHDSCSKIGFV